MGDIGAVERDRKIRTFRSFVVYFLNFNLTKNSMGILLIIEKGFEKINVDSKYKLSALKFIKLWLTDPQFADYVPQIEYLAAQENWDTLLDCFYQIIPFGTAGRRGEVGIGPNRINTWTIMSSAQGHSQYLIKKFGKEAKSRGVVISYDVRVYKETDIYDTKRKNPVYNLDCKTLSEVAATVYAYNGIKTYLFKDYTSTPEMSFMVKHKNAVAGDMISASHNPPEFNGIKVVNEFGGQLVPPYDQELVDIVEKQTEAIKFLPFKESLALGLINYITEEEHNTYIKSVSEISITHKTGAKIYFSPLSGTAISTIFPVLKRLGHNIEFDPPTSLPDGTFSNIQYNIPNPEVKEAFACLIDGADKNNSDIILTADPDGDRIGLMSKEEKEWIFHNGNEIFILCVNYILTELSKLNRLNTSNVIVKTLTTSNLIYKIAKKYGVTVVGDLLVGMKYIANEMNKLEESGRNNDFLIGGEESHGMTAFKHIKEKDAVVPAILLAELTSSLKEKNQTIKQSLTNIYKEFGYYYSFQNEIRLPGAEGMSQIAKIQEQLRNIKPTRFNNFKIIDSKDYWDKDPFLSESDKVSRNVISYHFDTAGTNASIIQVIIRPSGTEPKTKIYFEIGMNPKNNLEDSKLETINIGENIEKAVIKKLYRLIGIDFPDRAFLLFRMLPTNAKLKYFEIEKDIVALKIVKDQTERKGKLNDLLKFLGADPIEKVDKAFKVKYKVGIKKYLELN